jgi:hypothetical protein
MSLYKRSVFQLLSLAITLILVISYIPTTNSQVVCSEDELIRELYEDIIDNGKLDCLRRSVSPNGADETEEQRKRRIAAEWDSDCSFEADNSGSSNWVPKLLNNFGLKKGLVDVNGDPVDKDFDDQADMCEIVRALVANGKIPEIGEDVKSIDLKLLDYIDCPGSEGQTEVCAATGGSFADQKGWLIMLDGSSITINKEPKFVLGGNK